MAELPFLLITLSLLALVSMFITKYQYSSKERFSYRQSDKNLTWIVSCASLSRSRRTSRLFSLSSKAPCSSRTFFSDSLLGAGEELRGRDARPGVESSEYTERSERDDGTSRRGVRSVRLLYIDNRVQIDLIFTEINYIYLRYMRNHYTSFATLLPLSVLYCVTR